MPKISTAVSCSVLPSVRVRQVAGMFDVPLAEKAERCFSVDVPGSDEPWRIGAIVGPSGSGKSTVARAAFGEALAEPQPWPSDRAVVDGFGDASIRDITRTLTAVGFSSPPAWVRPYRTLSNGEQFRCDLARALLNGGDLVAFDEFTSVVDRTVASIGSAAVARAVREHDLRRFVAVSCHYDILEWLEPDWVLDMADGQLARRWLRPDGRTVWRRPGIELEIGRCRRSAWRLFAPHHYLSTGLHNASQCYLATWAGRPVAFVAMLHMAGRRGRLRVSRVVVLPDFQGVSIGSRVMDEVCDLHHNRGKHVSITTSHPAMVAHLKRSRRWRAVKLCGAGQGRNNNRAYAGSESTARAVASFQYIGPAA